MHKIEEENEKDHIQFSPSIISLLFERNKK